MFSLPIHTRRYFAALILIAIMLFQGVCEIGILTVIYAKDLAFSPASSGQVCGAERNSASGNTGDAEDENGEKSACCSAPKEIVQNECGCTCCGDVCKMGAACNCRDGKPAPPLGSFFFEVPSCGGITGKMITVLPPSLQFMFLMPEKLTLTNNNRTEKIAPFKLDSYCDAVRNPLVPPPKNA